MKDNSDIKAKKKTNKASDLPKSLDKKKNGSLKKTKTKDNSLENLLLDQNLILADQLQVAKKQLFVEKGKSLGDILVSMGFITQNTLAEVISVSSGVKRFDLKSMSLDSRLIKKIAKDVALKYKVVPVNIDDRNIVVAMSDIYDVIAIDKVKRCFPERFNIQPVYSPESDILDVIDQYYDYEMSIEGIISEIEGTGEGLESGEEELRSKEGYKNPIIRLVDSILIDAVHRNASDIHFEPEAGFLRLRYRIDGSLIQAKALHIDYWPPLAVRIKILSGINIAENRKSQDGHATEHILGRNIDFRVATQPTINGENIVMRILDKAKSLVSLDELGYSKRNQKILKRLLRRPEGVVIVTGPTGSGKTTTLYSILNYINSIDKNIMTLEDPVEYELPLIRQSAVKEGVISFADGIKSLLRQDPDIIFVGEIRDEETSSIAIRAAMTGHQVYTTLHTNNAVGVISRLSDIGVKPFLLSGSLICCIAQRLVRILCKFCKEEYVATDEDAKILAIDKKKKHKIFRSKGCDKCDNIGYKGRTCVSEILPISSKIDEMIALSSTTNSIVEQAVKEGYMQMAEDGIEKVLSGVTSLEEVIRKIDMTSRL